jgi:hypothetical protein
MPGTLIHRYSMSHHKFMLINVHNKFTLHSLDTFVNMEVKTDS